MFAQCPACPYRNTVATTCSSSGRAPLQAVRHVYGIPRLGRSTHVKTHATENVDAAVLMTMPIAQVAAASQLFGGVPLVCSVRGIDYDLDLGNVFVAFVLALTGLLPISWYLFAWQANKQMDNAGKAMQTAQQERAMRESAEASLRSADERRAAAEERLKKEVEKYEAKIVTLTSAGESAAATLKAKEEQLKELQKRLLVARARSGELQPRAAEPKPAAVVPLVPVHGAVPSAARHKLHEVERKRAALQEELQVVLERSKELQQVLASRRAAQASRS